MPMPPFFQTDGTAGTRATRRSAAPAPRTSPTRAPSSTGSPIRGRSGAGKREGSQIEILMNYYN